MKMTKKSISEKIKTMLFGTPIKGQKAYPPSLSFKTTYPDESMGYNEWMQKNNISSAVVKKFNT